METLISFAKGLGILVGIILGAIIFTAIARILFVWKKEGWNEVKRDEMLKRMLELGISIITHGISHFFAELLWPYIKGLNTRMRLREINGTDLWVITGVSTVIAFIISFFLGFNNPTLADPLAQLVFSRGILFLMAWILYVRFGLKTFGVRNKEEIKDVEDSEDQEELAAFMLFGRKPIGNAYAGFYSLLPGIISLKKETRNVFLIKGEIVIMHASSKSSKASEEVKKLFEGDPYHKRMETSWGYELRIEIDDYCQLLRTIGSLPGAIKQLKGKIEGAMDRILAHYTPADAKYLQSEIRDKILEEIEKLIQEKGFKIKEKELKITTLDEEKEILELELAQVDSSKKDKLQKKLKQIEKEIKGAKDEIESLKKDKRKEAEDEINRIKNEIREAKDHTKRVKARIKRIGRRIKKEGKHIAFLKFSKWLKDKKEELAKFLSDKKDELDLAKIELAKIMSRKDRCDSWGLNAVDLEIKLKEDSPHEVVIALANVSAAELKAKAVVLEAEGEKKRIILIGEGNRKATFDELIAHADAMKTKNGKEAVQLKMVIKALETGENGKTIILPADISGWVNGLMEKMAK